MNELELRGNLDAVQARIEAAAMRCGRRPSAVVLVGVSKYVPADVLCSAVAAGQAVFGESYVQEARAKIPALTRLLEERGLPLPKWHLIGALQRNKVKYAVGVFDLIHSVDRFALAEEISRYADRGGLRQNVLIQINISGEASKAGTAPGQAAELCRRVLQLPGLELKGLMSIGTYFPADTPETVRRSELRAMSELRTELEAQIAHPLPELSMGMSDDFPLAVEEGATIIRVGTAIFGPRGEY